MGAVGLADSWATAASTRTTSGTTLRGVRRVLDGHTFDGKGAALLPELSPLLVSRGSFLPHLLILEGLADCEAELWIGVLGATSICNGTTPRNLQCT